MDMELDSCKHCGGKAFVQTVIINDSTSYSCYCDACRVRTGFYGDMQLAVNAWNCRADEWISVDTPPKINEFVILNANEQVGFGFYMGKENANGHKIFIFYNKNGRISTMTFITGWMPLPEAVKKES
jgi:hypothetical protein